jgi:UDP-N-acetylglucosamine 2-epimerase (non-hydrolysing)
MRIISVAGARPNFMKTKPVLQALEERGVETILVHTGQHYDTAMSDVFFDELGLRAPDHALGVGSGSHADQTGRVMSAFEGLLEEAVGDLVVVVGDVNSTLACALVGAKAGCLVAHVEAGLRSRDWAMPEEINRVATDRVSDLLFAPSAGAVANLESEGYRADQIHLVGNVMVDTLLANLERARAGRVHERLELEPEGYVFVTLHRPANVDEPDVREGILGALEEVAADLPVVLPVHPRLQAGMGHRVRADDLRTIEPVGYLDSIALQDGAALVLTDSGGVQEETTILGVPCLTLRDNTERPVTVTEGTNRVVGRDPGRIVEASRETLRAPHTPRRPEFWDGKAGDRIADAIIERLRDPEGLRPTDVPD